MAWVRALCTMFRYAFFADAFFSNSFVHRSFVDSFYRLPYAGAINRADYLMVALIG